MSKFCPNCGVELEDDALFCAECGEKLDSGAQTGENGNRNSATDLTRMEQMKEQMQHMQQMQQKLQERNAQAEEKAPESSSFVAPYPKSQKLNEKGGINSKLVCSCGSDDFEKRLCYFIGSSYDDGYLENAGLTFNYRCAKCGAEVYLSIEKDGQYFCFVPKEKQEEAKQLVGIHDEECAFTKSFCISEKWDELLPLPDFSDTYVFLRHALHNPKICKFYLEKQPLEFQNESKLCEMFEKTNWEFAEEERDEYARDLSIAKKTGVGYLCQFGPGVSFAIDDDGEIVLNDNPDFVPDEERFKEFDFSKFERWGKVLQAYSEVNDEDDKYVGALSHVVDNDTVKDMIKSFELTGSAWFVDSLLAYANYKMLGGERILIYRDCVWIQSKPLIGKAETELVKFKDIDEIRKGGSDEMSFYLGDTAVTLRGPKPETVKKLVKALRLHLEFYEWFQENR